MERETDQARGPDPADWLATVVRSAHPLRWLGCVIGLLFSFASVVVLDALFNSEWPNWGAWWVQPIDQLLAFCTMLVRGSLLGFLVRGGIWLMILTSIWSPVLGWIARHELLARRTTSDDLSTNLSLHSPTAVVVKSLRGLLTCCPAVMWLTLLLLLPTLIASWFTNHMGSMGAVTVAALLPLVLVANLIVFLFAFGGLAWPLMPIAIVAEHGDVFDALSRSYNYQYRHPFRYLFYLACMACVASTPTVLFVLVEPAIGVPNEARMLSYLAVLGLSLSIGGSLQTLIYLHMRTLVDDVDADELVDEPSPLATESPPAPPSNTNAPTSEYRPPSLITAVLLSVVVLITWCLTYGLLAWNADGQSAAWLGWGFHEGFAPPNDGLRGIAAMIALVWGIVWLLLPIIVYALSLRRTNQPSELFTNPDIVEDRP